MVVVLILGVILTIGVSIAMRGVTEVNISTSQKESAVALEAAEAGVEQALGGFVTVSATGTTANASYDVSQSSLALGDTKYILPYKLDRGDTATVSLSGYSSPTICVYWGDDAALEGAVELILYSSNGSTYSVGRYGVDPDSGVHGNGFSGVVLNASCNLTEPARKTLVNFSSDLGLPGGYNPLVLRLRALYNADPISIAVQGTNSGVFPSQGSVIFSSGKSADVVQRVKATAVNADLPVMFDSAIFSGASLVQ